MSKEVGKIYSAVDADELEVGDIVVVGDTLWGLKTQPKEPLELKEIEDCDIPARFVVIGNFNYYLAKLICPKKHAEVYKAWKNGAKVKYRLADCGDWLPTDTPQWDEDTDFKVVNKQEPTCRPFKDIDELVETWEKMIGYKAKPNTMPLIWVKNKLTDCFYCISGFDSEEPQLLINANWCSLAGMLSNCTFLDGTPFGVREE